VTVHSAPAMHMSKSFGGAQQIMRDTKIIKESGFLGPYTRKLKVGDIQSMIFKSDDAGPWYLSSEQREAQRDDRATGRITRVERSKNLLTKAYRSWSRTSSTEEFHETRSPSICKETQYRRI
jgi:hypothetical protein